MRWIFLAGTMLLVGCTWVPLTPQGADVAIGYPGDVAQCEKLGFVGRQYPEPGCGESRPA